MKRASAYPLRLSRQKIPYFGFFFAGCIALLAVAISATASQPPPAVETERLTLLQATTMTLERDPNIVLAESRYRAARGLVLSARGLFDPRLRSTVDRDQIDTPTGVDTSDEETTLTTTFGLDALLRSGLSLEPGLTLFRRDDRPALNQATVSFTVRQPLLRDRGREVVTAGERAAEQELAARRYDLRHDVSSRLLSVIASFWSYRAAAMNLEILRATEESSRELLDSTRKLIEADLVPAADIDLLEADLTAKASNRIAGERRLFEARQDLGLEIGLRATEILELPLPADDFPRLDAEEVPVDEMLLWADRSLLLRNDVLAARERLIASEILLRAAENALEPRLDLILTPSYSGRVEGDDAGDFFSPLYTNVPGFSTSFGLSFSWPILNRGAAGDRLQAEEARHQSAVFLELLENTIGAEVPTALDAVYRNALQVERIVRAVGYFTRAVDNERKKLRAGSSTLIDVISQRDRLTSIQQQEIAARLALAQALADLRFRSGTLLAQDGERDQLERQRLITLPFQESER